MFCQFIDVAMEAPEVIINNETIEGIGVIAKKEMFDGSNISIHGAIFGVFITIITSDTFGGSHSFIVMMNRNYIKI